MNRKSGFQFVPFEEYRLLDELEAGAFAHFDRETSYELMGEVSRSGAAYVRWIQQSLNKILSLRLKVDGDLGVQTRSAIRSFQQQRGLVADGLVGAKTEAALIAAGAGPPPGGSGSPVASAACPPKPSLIVCPAPGTAPTAVLDKFDYKKSDVKPLHTPIINRIAQQILASQGSAQPIRSIRIVGHTDPVGSDRNNLGLGQRRAEAVAHKLCSTLDGMRRGIASQLRYDLTTCGERQRKATPEASRRVELFLPQAAPPVTPIPSGSGLQCPAPPIGVPPGLNVLIGLVHQLLGSLAPVLGLTGVKLPTTARFLTNAEQLEAEKVFSCSLDFSRILISDGVGFSGRLFTVAVPLASRFHTVLLMGDVGLSAWLGSKAHNLIHELTHSWQSQHHGNDPTAYMRNSVRCQAAALADLPIAKAEAAAVASFNAARRGVVNPIDLAGIAASAAANEGTSSYAYIPGRPFSSYAAEQIAQQVENSYLRNNLDTNNIVRTIRSVGANARSLDNERSLGVTSFHRRSTPGVVFP